MTRNTHQHNETNYHVVNDKINIMLIQFRSIYWIRIYSKYMSPIVVIPSYLNASKADRNKINTEERKQNEMKIDWKRKLTSRKLWMAIAGFVTGLILAFSGAEETAQTVSGCIMSLASVIAYIVGEGLTDVASIQSGTESDNGG